MRIQRNPLAIQEQHLINKAKKALRSNFDSTPVQSSSDKVYSAGTVADDGTIYETWILGVTPIDQLFLSSKIF